MNQLPDSILYPMESRADLERMALQLRAEYQPSGEFEEQLFERMLEASWYRRRYETVRSKLYERKHQLPSDSPQMAVTMDSIRRFQHEVEQAKKQIAGLRKLLRRYRAGEVSHQEEQLNDCLLAA